MERRWNGKVKRKRGEREEKLPKLPWDRRRRSIVQEEGEEEQAAASLTRVAAPVAPSRHCSSPPPTVPAWAAGARMRK